MRQKTVLERQVAHLPKVHVPCHIAYDAHEIASHVLLVELLKVHERGVILSAEPLAALADLGVPDVAAVPLGRFSPRAIVLIEAVFEERLRKRHLDKTAVGSHGHRLCRAQQRPGVNDSQERDLLLPNLDHRVIESGDEALPFLLRLLFGERVRYRSHGLVVFDFNPFIWIEPKVSEHVHRHLEIGASAAREEVSVNLVERNSRVQVDTVVF